ncbi:MAG: helix-turn-helix domain-containing protein [Romboutsia timonensis]
MLKYDKLLTRLSEYGYTATKVRETGLIGQGTYYGLKDGTKNLDGKTINKLCDVLECQPSDIIEYVPDNCQNSNNLNTFTNEEIGKRLCDLRNNNHLSKTEMAYSLGIEYPKYINYENGTTRAKADVLSKACKLYDVPQSYFGINSNLVAVGNKGKDYSIQNSNSSETLVVSDDEFQAVKEFLEEYRKK